MDLPARRLLIKCSYLANSGTVNDCPWFLLKQAKYKDQKKHNNLSMKI